MHLLLCASLIKPGSFIFSTCYNLSLCYQKMNQIRWLCKELYNYTHDIYCILVTCTLSEPQNWYHRNCYRTVAQVKMIWDEELIQISLGHILSLSEQRAFLIENCVVIINFSHFCLLQNHWIKFNQTQHKALLGKGDLSLFKWMGTPFPSGDDNQIVIIHWWNWKLFFSRTTGQISTKLGRKHSWEKGIQVFANKGLFSFSNRTLNQCYGIIKPLCRYVYWLELFLRWVMWPMGLLFTNSYSLKYTDKLLESSSPEYSSQFQPNLAQSILVLTVQ